MKSVACDLKSVEPDGTFSGYASRFNVVDLGRDLVLTGAFTQSLRERGPRGIKLLFQHDPAEPIGVWFELTEDFRGLRARGKLDPEVARARELIALVKSGAVDGLSIGFRTVKGRIDPASRVRKIIDLDLWEISIVTFPLLAGARVRAVKGSASSPPQLSYARARAEREWSAMRGGVALPVAPPLRVARMKPQARLRASSTRYGAMRDVAGRR
jgi:hypothetical protein